MNTTINDALIWLSNKSLQKDGYLCMFLHFKIIETEIHICLQNTKSCAYVRDFLLFFRRGEAKRIRGPICGVVSVHGSFNTKMYTWTTEYKNNKRGMNKTQNCTVWWKTQTRKQTPTNTQWNPGYLRMILNQRQLMTPASDWEPY